MESMGTAYFEEATEGQQISLRFMDKSLRKRSVGGTLIGYLVMREIMTYLPNKDTEDSKRK